MSTYLFILTRNERIPVEVQAESREEAEQIFRDGSGFYECFDSYYLPDEMIFVRVVDG